MKCTLAFFILYLIATFSWADTCPEPAPGDYFIGAYWFKSKYSNSSPVTCEYASGNILSQGTFMEKEIAGHYPWTQGGVEPNIWYQCFRNLPRECKFEH